jgi:hypothetical protein
VVHAFFNREAAVGDMSMLGRMWGWAAAARPAVVYYHNGAFVVGTTVHPPSTACS